MPKFEFLTFSSHPQVALQDETLRRAIRATATRATRSRESQRVAVSHELRSKASKQASQKGGTNRFRLKPSVSLVESQPPAASSELSLPLNKHVSFWYSIVAPLGGEAWRLLQYYRCFFRPNSWAINAKHDWFTFIIQDKAATHATLSFVSLNRDLEEGSKVSSWTLHHRMRAIQLIRDGIENASSHPTDGLIGAVALVAITEGLEGDSLTSVAHVKALEKLVELRGGAKEIKHNEALTRLVAWADLCRTSNVSDGTQLSTLLNDEKDLTQSETDPKPSEGLLHFHETAYLELIQSLNLLPNNHPNDATPPAQRQTTSRLIYRIEQQIGRFRYHHCVSCEGTMGLLARALHCAAHLYVSLVLRQIPRRTSLVTRRSWIVGITLDPLFDSIISGQHPDEMSRIVTLWATTVRFCSLPSERRTLEDISQLRQLMKICGVNTFESLVEVLKRITWIDEFCEVDLREVCAEILPSDFHLFR